MPHQIRYAEHFARGLRTHGHQVLITEEIARQADVNVVIGPHYAKDYHLNSDRVILIDRAYYQKDPDYVSVGWMNKNGGRDFLQGTGRKPPEVIHDHSDSGTIFLTDYNGITEPADHTRYHPVNMKAALPLKDDLRRFKTAIGYRTTALVTAALMGLEVVCRDKENIVYQDNWLDLLPYADWHHLEIEKGETWEHLQSSLNQLGSQ